jgi:hypothetical protein
VRFVADGRVGLVAGADSGLFDFGLVDGTSGTARFQHPLGVVYSDGAVLVADTYNSVIRRIDVASGVVTTIAGTTPGWSDGPVARFDEPGGVDVAGTSLYVADTNNHAIRIVDLTTGDTRTLVLFGIERFRTPIGESDVITLDPVTLGPGEASLSVAVALPAGYVVNDLAPFSIGWSGEGLVIDAGDRQVVAPEFPIEIAVTGLQASSGTLTVDITTYFCTAETKDLCLIDQVRLEVPVTVTAGAGSTATISYAVPAPAG